jgi:hypothetical protein
LDWLFFAMVVYLEALIFRFLFSLGGENKEVVNLGTPGKVFPKSFRGKGELGGFSGLFGAREKGARALLTVCFLMTECLHCKCETSSPQRCADCGRGPFCCVRCRTMDYEIGAHDRECVVGTTYGTRESSMREVSDRDDPDASGLPWLFTRAPGREYIPYQAPPHVRAFALATHPSVAALELPTASDAAVQWLLNVPMPGPDDPRQACLHGADSYGGDQLLIVPRLTDGVYVLLGEDDFETVHESDGHPSHRFVGSARWDVPLSLIDLAGYSMAVGRVLGELHFGRKVDAFGFSVVSARAGGSRARLFVQCDPRRTRALSFDLVGDPDVDTVDRLSFILGRLAYVPAPRQASLFRAFASGYRASAKAAQLESYAKDVLERMRVYVD